MGTRGINEAYRTGRGKIKVRAVTDIEPMANGKNRMYLVDQSCAILTRAP